VDDMVECYGLLGLGKILPLVHLRQALTRCHPCQFRLSLFSTVKVPLDTLFAVIDNASEGLGSIVHNDAIISSSSTDLWLSGSGRLPCQVYKTPRICYYRAREDNSAELDY
jgi:hypothetical protein